MAVPTCINITIALHLLVVLPEVASVKYSNLSKPMKELTKHLFHDYDGFVRPVFDGKSPTFVTFRMLLYALIDMDTRNQRFKITTWNKLTWTDEFLRWNATEFGEIDVIHVRADKLWLPDITLHQNVEDTFENVSPDTYANVESNGLVTWYAPTIYGSSCRQRVRYFPFDTQVCPMRLSSWAYDGKHIELKTEVGPDTAQSRFLDNGVWRFVSVKTHDETVYYPCCPDEPYYEIIYTLIFRRNAAFYVRYLILPCIFLSTLSLLVFYLPPDSGEKLTLSITNLLALVVFQQLIAETMPPSDDDSPLLGTYFLVMIVMVCVSVVATVIVIHVGYKKSHMPRWFEVLFLDVMARCVCLDRLTHSSDTENTLRTNPASGDQISMSCCNCGRNSDGHHQPEATTITDCANGDVNDDVNNRNDTRYLVVNKVTSPEVGDITRSVAVIRSHFELKALDDDMQTKWRMVAMVIDRWLLFIFVTFFTLVTVILTTCVVTMSDKEFQTLIDGKDGT